MGAAPAGRKAAAPSASSTTSATQARPGMGYILEPAPLAARGSCSEAVGGGAGLRLRGRFETLIASNSGSMPATSPRSASPSGRDSGDVAHSARSTRTKRASHEKLVYGLRLEEWRPRSHALRFRQTTDRGLQPAADPGRAGRAGATAEYYRDKLGFEITFLFRPAANLLPACA